MFLKIYENYELSPESCPGICPKIFAFEMRGSDTGFRLRLAGIDLIYDSHDFEIDEKKRIKDTNENIKIKGLSFLSSFKSHILNAPK